MRKILFLCAMIMGSCAAHAQNTLQVGDTIPDQVINGVINFDKGSVRIKDFKDKLLILDFGFTGCGGCIHMLPKIDKMARESKGRMQYLWVTYEPADKVSNFFKKNQELKGLSIPTITGAKALYTLFGVTVAPQEIWIRNSMVVAITGSDYLTPETVSTAASANGSLNWLQRKNISNDFLNQPLLDFQNAEIPKTTVKFYSTITDMLPAAPLVTQHKSFQRLSDKGYARLQVHYKSILGLYRFAIPMLDQGELAINKVFLLEVKDKSIYDYMYHSTSDPRMSYISEWYARYGHSYDSTAPLSMSESEMKAKMLQDLNYYFHLNGRRETRQVKAMVLRMKAGSKGPETEDKYSGPSFFSTQNGMISPSDLTGYLNSESQPGEPIYVDETGYQKEIRLDIHGIDINDTKLINKRLAKQGMELVEDRRPFPLIVISE